MREVDLNSIITFNPAVIDVTTSVAELLQQVVQAEFHHWPVADENLRLLGIVSEQDIARVVHQLACDCASDPPRAARFLSERTAGQIMTAPVVIVSRWDSQLSGLYYLLKNKIHSLPVIEDGRLIGVVTSTDYLREFSYGDLSICRQPVSDWLIDGMEAMDCDASLQEASEAIAQAGFEHLPLVSGTLSLGVVDARDLRLAQCRLEGRTLLADATQLPGPTTLRELALASPVIRPGTRLSEAADLMVQHHRQAIAVVTQSGRFVGVISESILLSAMAGQKPSAVPEATQAS